MDHKNQLLEQKYLNSKICTKLDNSELENQRLRMKVDDFEFSVDSLLKELRMSQQAEHHPNVFKDDAMVPSSRTQRGQHN